MELFNILFRAYITATSNLGCLQIWFRSARFCDGTNSTALAKACGRPSGLGFYYKTGELYVADDGVGLVVIGPKGGAGKVLASGAEKVPFGLPDGLDVDQNTGIVYFPDATARYTIKSAS